jgi:predicted dehydrogenase
MNTLHRRDLLSSAAAAGLLLASPRISFAAAEDRIRIGQIGTRHAHAGGKMATLRKFPDLYEVVGVVEPDAEQRKRVADSATYRGVAWMTEETLLAIPGLQAVAVETEVRQLVPTAARCVDANLHVHLDKPAGESLSDFQSLLDDATRRQRTLQMGYMYRYNPAFQFLFQAVRNGWLGDVFEVHAVMSKKVNDSTRRELADYPGGSMFELGCHLIDAVVSVLGRPDRVTPFNRNTQPGKDNLLDNCLAVLEYPKATATVRSAVVEVDGGRRRQLIVCGSQGTVEIKPLEPPQLSLTLDRDRESYRQGQQQVQLPQLEGRYDGDFLDLAQIIRGEKQSDYPPKHDLAVHETILRASGL